MRAAGHVLDEWVQTRLGDVARISHGWAFKGESMVIEESELPVVVGIGNFDYSGGFRFDDSTIKRYSGQYPNEYELRAGDILLVMTCQTEGGEILGIPGRVPDDDRTYLHNQRLGRLEIVRPDLLDPSFFFQMARTAEFNGQLFLTASGSKILHTSPSRIEATIFIRPPLQEQRAIAEVLGALDDKIAANTKLAETLAELASAKFTVASRSSVGDAKLSEIVTTQYGVTTSAHDGEGPRFLRVTDINKKPWIAWDSTPSCTVNSDDLAKYRVEAGDILVARMADPGKAAFIDEGDPVAVFASYLVRVRAIDPDQSLYIYYFLRSTKYREYAEGAMQGSVQMNMNAKVIVATDIPMLPSEVIAEFGLEVGGLRKSIQAALRENRTLAATRDALLPQLMCGALRIKDAEKAIEEVL